MTQRSRSHTPHTSAGAFPRDGRAFESLHGLTDGRFLVVEHKGEDRWSNDDSKEKRDIGGLWEARSSGTCLFVLRCA